MNIPTRYIRLFLGALIAVVLGLFIIGHLNYVNEIEFQSRLGMPSQSSADAERDSVLERRPWITTPVIQVRDYGAIKIADAWIERRSRVVYRYYLYRHREPVGGYMLSYTVSPDTGSWVNQSGGRFEVTSGNNPESWMVKIGNTFVWYRHIGPPLPDSLRFGVCENKYDERRTLRQNLREELPECIPHAPDG